MISSSQRSHFEEPPVREAEDEPDDKPEAEDDSQQEPAPDVQPGESAGVPGTVPAERRGQTPVRGRVRPASASHWPQSPKRRRTDGRPAGRRRPGRPRSGCRSARKSGNHRDNSFRIVDKTYSFSPYKQISRVSEPQKTIRSRVPARIVFYYNRLWKKVHPFSLWFGQTLRFPDGAAVL